MQQSIQRDLFTDENDPAPRGKLISQHFLNDDGLGLAREVYFSYEKDWHSHAYYNFAFPMSAQGCRFELDSGEGFMVPQGQLLIMQPGIIHRQSHACGVWDNFALFPHQQIIQDQQLSSLLGGAPVSLIVSCSPLLLKLVERLQDKVIVEKHHLARHAQEYFLALQLIGETLENNTNTINEKKAHDQEMKTIIRFIQDHLFEDLTPEALADRFGLSRSHLYRLFKAYTQQSIGEYLRSQRLNAARQMLRQNHTTVTSVAAIIGYQDAYAFSNAYLRQFGHRPSADQLKSNARRVSP